MQNPVSKKIANAGFKLDSAIGILFSSPLLPLVLELCGQDPSTEPQRKHLSGALGLNEGDISNVKTNNDKNIAPGRAIDLFALMGFGPSIDELAKLETDFLAANGYNPYAQPKFIYKMMDDWIADTPACLCWAAFLGGAKQIRYFGLEPPPRAVERGAIGTRFAEVYASNLDRLSPFIHPAIHWLPNTPTRPIPSRSNVERARISKHIMIAEGPRPSESQPSTSLAPAEMPAWLSMENPLLDHQTPECGTSEFEIQEKMTLYGRSPRLSAGFPPIHFAFAKHTFDRADIEALRNAINNRKAICGSYTVKAGKGAGLSMALAQLARDLSQSDGYTVLWVIGDPARSRAAMRSLGGQEARELASWMATKPSPNKGLVIILDDVSLATPTELGRLVSFRNRCRTIFETNGSAQIIMVFGSFGAARTCSEDAEINLTLGDGDQRACYNKMAQHDPVVIRDEPDGLLALLRRQPDGRAHDNDAQAFIDFVLEQGNPTAAAADHWLARIDDLDESGTEVVAIAAAMQLLGLHLPEQLAVDLLSEFRKSRFESGDDIIHSFNRLVIVEDGWCGVGLTCPRRAKSILRRMNRYNARFLASVFSKVIDRALTRIVNGSPDAADCMNFSRHVFQRVAKPKLYKFAFRDQVLKRLSKDSGEQLGVLLRSAAGVDPSKWAGALSGSLLRGPRLGTINVQKTYASLTRQLVELSMRRFSQSDMTSDTAVSLLRATSRLVKSEHERPDGAIVQAITDLLPPTDLKQIIKLKLLGANDDDKRRANEIVHAYCRLQDAIWIGAVPVDQARQVSDWLDDLSDVFSTAGAAMDAGTWLERARFAKQSAFPRSEELAREYLDMADACIDFNPQSQMTWAPQAAQLRVELLTPAIGPASRDRRL